MTWWRGREKGVVDVCMCEQSLIMLHHVSDHIAEEATAIPILEPIAPSPGIEDVELPEEAKSELDEDDLSKEGDGSESKHDGKGSVGDPSKIRPYSSLTGLLLSLFSLTAFNFRKPKNKRKAE